MEIEESKRFETATIELSCSKILEQPPRMATEVVLKDFIVGKRVVKIDFDGDYEWDMVGVALFPSEKQRATYAYKAVIVCCKGIPDEDAFADVFRKEGPKSITCDYRPNLQDLNDSVHSQLATQYKNLDFSNSPVVLYGYERQNPLLGETSYQLSITVGSIAGLVAVATTILSLLIGLISSIFKRKPSTTTVPPRPRGNRARLPATATGPNDHEPTGGVLDRVRSMREKHPET